MLAEEDLALFRLVKDISKNEQIVSVSITNPTHTIIAHSDIDRVNKPFSPPAGLVQTETVSNDISIYSFIKENKEFLYLETPLSYQNVNVGRAQLTISQKTIEESIAQSKQYILVSFVIIIIAALLLSLGFSIYFSRPIKALEKNAAHFGAGNFALRASINRNDELGDLANAFNQMAGDLELKEKIKDSFGRYVAPEIVEIVLSNPSDHWLKAASKDATVLFTDIRGFTSLSENMAPEDIVEMLNTHFTRITEAVIRHGGHIDKFVGDAAMAVFGITSENPGHAEDAVAAALQIMEQIESHHRQSDPDSAIHLGIGINTGSMVAGNLGSAKRMEYTVIGDNVNIASRLTSIADPGEILITGNTFDCLKNMEPITAREKGQMTIKGKAKKIRVFSILPKDSINEHH